MATPKLPLDKKNVQTPANGMNSTAADDLRSNVGNRTLPDRLPLAPQQSPLSSEFPVNPASQPLFQSIWQGWSLKTKVALVALAIGTAPVLTVGALSLTLSDKTITRQQLFWTLLWGTGGTIAIVGGLGRTLADRATRPILSATQAIESIGRGQLTTRLNVSGTDELAILGNNINQMAGQIQSLLSTQTIEAERAQRLRDITLLMTKFSTPEDILKTAVTEIRQVLECDRVLVYQFDQNWVGTIVEESVAARWPQALHAEIDDPCFRQNWVEAYTKGRVQVTPDIYAAGLTECHLKQLEPFAVRANLVAPMLVEQKLVGLLIAHQCSGPRTWKTAEVDFFTQVATQIGLVLERSLYLQRTEEARREAQRLRDITLLMSQFRTPTDILKTAVVEIRQALECDRVLVYQFDQNWVGTVVEESVAARWPQALHAEIDDPCFRQDWVEAYTKGRVQATPDIYAAGLTECHLKELKPFAVRANLVAPMLVEQKLIGLLIAHQCSGPRDWKTTEVDFFTQVATQIGLVLERSLYLQRTEEARREAEILAKEQQQQKEEIQFQLINLLSEVEAASSGDLMVRADITAGSIGTVADIFNSLIESLRDVVLQVKQSTNRVNEELGSDEAAMRTLADDSLRQAKKIQRMLDAVEEMSQSIQAVASSANQAATVARQASETAQSGGEVVDTTVQSILHLRDTIAETAKKVKRLGESSQQISKVISLINQIALQTNLLAINASIEAARAGEEGRGFAVVAEEVGELAARSAAATKDIEQIVESIQRETNEVVSAMEMGTAQVVEGTQRAENAKQSLGQIVQVSQQIDELVQSISQATVAQSKTSRTVNILMQEIAKVSEAMSDSSRQISNSLQETVTVAQHLQASVDTFKVS
uniref:Methyl-accepting chemotaxis sensory transducer with GAF sensor n=1 Tax=Cyanothece sp. (strain PCC 7425 / ATCC 29141) TaxID=395961 RepID=B8HY11_CYAP4